jgi:hypothetical protein
LIRFVSACALILAKAGTCALAEPALLLRNSRLFSRPEAPEGSLRWFADGRSAGDGSPHTTPQFSFMFVRGKMRMPVPSKGLQAKLSSALA